MTREPRGARFAAAAAVDVAVDAVEEAGVFDLVVLTLAADRLANVSGFPVFGMQPLVGRRTGAVAFVTVAATSVVEDVVLAAGDAASETFEAGTGNELTPGI